MTNQPTLPKLTFRARQLLARLTALAQQGKPCPTNSALADSLGMPTPSQICPLLDQLEAAGQISRQGKQLQRSITLVDGIVLRPARPPATPYQRRPPSGPSPHRQLAQAVWDHLWALPPGACLPTDAELCRVFGRGSPKEISSTITTLVKLGKISRPAERPARNTRTWTLVAPDGMTRRLSARLPNRTLVRTLDQPFPQGALP